MENRGRPSIAHAVIALMGVLLTLACAPEIPDIPAVNSPTAAVHAVALLAPEKERFVLFPADRAAGLVRQCSRPKPGPVEGTWTLDASLVGQMERLLEPAFARAIQKARPRLEDRRPFVEYYRQYGGLIVSGRRMIYVNAFHEHILRLGMQLKPPRPGPDWRLEPVDVCDGWTAFFGAEFDVDSATIVRLDFNGRVG